MKETVYSIEKISYCNSWSVCLIYGALQIGQILVIVWLLNSSIDNIHGVWNRCPHDSNSIVLEDVSFFVGCSIKLVNCTCWQWRGTDDDLSGIKQIEQSVMFLWVAYTYAVPLFTPRHHNIYIHYSVAPICIISLLLILIFSYSSSQFVNIQNSISPIPILTKFVNISCYQLFNRLLVQHYSYNTIMNTIQYIQ